MKPPGEGDGRGPRRLRAVPVRAPVVRPSPPAPPRRVSPGRTEAAARALQADLGRDVVEHGLTRHRALAAVRRGAVRAWDVCDAHPHLVTAATHYGVPTARACPICENSGLTEVHFVYGESLKHVAGQAKTPLEVRRLAAGNGRDPRVFDVHVVEVCGHCRWNHLLRSFVVAGDASRPPGAGNGRGRAGSAAVGG